MKNVKNKIFIGLFLVILVMIIACLVWLKPKTTTNTQEKNVIKQNNQLTKNSENSPTNTPRIIPKIPNTNSSQSKQTGLENLPRSLQGTKVDGEIIIDENKQLVVTYGLKRLFDYFLSAQGEESDKAIHQRIKNYITSHTPEPASSQAIEIYQQYVAYLQALGGLEKEFGNLQMRATKDGKLDINLIKQRQAKVIQLQEKYFQQATIKAFFKTDKMLENYTLAMLAIDKNKNLSEKQKLQARKNYIANMENGSDKKAMQKQQEQQANLAELIKRTETMKKQGATAEQLYTMRKSLVGEQSAKRLAEVDKEEADFAKRFATYQQKKQAIIQQFGENSPTSAEKIQQVEESLFNKNEQKRLGGYEMVHASTP